MRFLRTLTFLSLMATVLLSPVLAQEDIKDYLQKTDPMIVELQSNIKNFLGEVQPLRDDQDFVGLKTTADKYVGIWNGMLERLNAVAAPDEAGKHYQALTQLLEQQRESNQIMSDTLANRIEVIQEIQKMEQAGASQEQVDAFVKENALDREELVEKTTAVKQATTQADQSLKAERERLLELVGAES